MRVLVCSKNAWNDMNAVGNTLSNFFGSQDNMEFSSLYSRSEKPANRICNDYYTITEMQMLKNIFKPAAIGHRFTLGFDEMDFCASSRSNSERKAINFVKKHSLKPVYALSDSLWKKDIWINDRLKDYIREFNPDILFSFATEPTVLRKRMELVRQLCGSKVVLFVADDVYSVYRQQNDGKTADDFKWCIENADLLYGASTELCEEYGKEFSRDFSFLCKGCNISEVKTDKPLSPIKLVYAGNLFYGRDEILAQLIGDISEINSENECKLFLEIYTASPVSEEMKPRLNVEGAGRVVGARAYDEIVKILHDAHIALQVESFEKQEIEKVRLSFSTKISDCLQSGSAVMAIGPDGISSVEYLKRVDGAFTVTDKRKIKSVLASIAENPKILWERANETNRFAKENHELSKVRERINNDFENILKD